MTGISDPLQMYSGRLDEPDVMTEGMRFWTPMFFFDRHSTVLVSPWVFFLTDITQFLLAHCYVALTNDMLKSYKVAQV